MSDKLGAFADANRAATPSEPSPETVSGIAGIPCAGALLHPVEYWNGKAYDVFHDGNRIGVVRHCFPTFERGPRQANYVTKRWRARRAYWEYLIGDSQRPSIDCATRIDAVEKLIRAVNRDSGSHS